MHSPLGSFATAMPSTSRLDFNQSALAAWFSVSALRRIMVLRVCPEYEGDTLAARHRRRLVHPLRGKHGHVPARA